MYRWLRGVHRSLRRSLRRRGVAGTIARAAGVIGRIRTSVLNPAPLWMDRRLGIDTALSADLADLHVRGPNAAHGNIYHPSSWESVRQLLGTLDIRHQDFQFVDVGCGKGLVLLAASEYPFGRVLGIEFAEELCAIAERNIAKYNAARRCADVQVVCADAIEYSYLPLPTVFYLYNPFDDAMLARFAERLKDSLARAPREVVILYNGRGRHPVFDRLGELQRIPIDQSRVVYRHRACRSVTA